MNENLLTRLVCPQEQRTQPSLPAGKMSVLQANLMRALQPAPKSDSNHVLLHKVKKVEDIVTTLKTDVLGCADLD